MSDRTEGAAVILGLIVSVVGMLLFGIPRDTNFGNPKYAACRNRGGAYQDCIHYVRDERKCRDR